MQLEIPGVRIADAETCDFGLMPTYDTAALLRLTRPDDAERLLSSPVALAMLAELGVERRNLTQLPGAPAAADRLTALDLARSAVLRLKERQRVALGRLDALIFVSTSNPFPCNSQAALLADACGLRASCFDLKAGCSGGVLGLVQGALLIQGGCERVLVVMAENLSQLTSPGELRMLATVGDGAACVLLERSAGAGFRSVIHGSAPEHSAAMRVRAPFPPREGPGQGAYAYEVGEATAAREFLHAKWRSLHRESVAAAGLGAQGPDHWFFHQTHRAQVEALARELGAGCAPVERIAESFGNVGTPSFAVALARGFPRLRRGDTYLLQAVGGGISWCAIVGEHAEPRGTASGTARAGARSAA